VVYYLLGVLFFIYVTKNAANYKEWAHSPSSTNILKPEIESLVDNLDKTKLENDERVSGIISDFKSLEDIVKNLKNENKQLDNRES
jgi:hypothetical protein